MKNSAKFLVGSLTVIVFGISIFWVVNTRKENFTLPEISPSAGIRSSSGVKRFVIEAEPNTPTIQTGEVVQFFLRLVAEETTLAEVLPEQGAIVAVFVDPSGAKSSLGDVTIDENFWRTLQYLETTNPSFSRRMPISDIRPKIPGTYTVSADIYYPFPPKGHGGKVPNIEIQNYVFTVTAGVEQFLILRDTDSYRVGSSLARRDADADVYFMDYGAKFRVNGILGNVSVMVANTHDEAGAQTYFTQEIEAYAENLSFLQKKEMAIGGGRISVWETENPQPNLPSTFVAGWVSGEYVIKLQGMRGFGPSEEEIAAAYLKKYPASPASGR